MMKVVKIVKTIGPEGNWERTRAYVERKPVKMSVVDALLSEEGWTKAEDTRVEKPCNWLPYKEITTIVLTKRDNSIFMDFREKLFRDMGIACIC